MSDEKELRGPSANAWFAWANVYLLIGLIILVTSSKVEWNQDGIVSMQMLVLGVVPMDQYKKIVIVAFGTALYFGFRSLKSRS